MTAFGKPLQQPPAPAQVPSTPQTTALPEMTTLPLNNTASEIAENKTQNTQQMTK